LNAQCHGEFEHTIAIPISIFSGIRAQVWLFLISQQFSLRIPDLQAMAVGYIMIWTQRFGGFER
jgi:hypothetical protein